MWEFKSKQKILDIDGVKVGGVPGERPVVLIGSIFYRKHSILKNEMKGDFDKEAAEELVNKQSELSDKTGNPCMIDVVGASSEALIKAIDFIAGVSDCPLLFDGLSAKMRIEALSYFKNSGLSERIVYNSITPDVKDDELEALKQSRVNNVLFLAYYVKDFTSRGRLEIIKKMIPLLEESGINNVLVDTVVLDIPSLGSACKAIFDVKNELGYPAGCGAHNAIGTWRGLKNKFGLYARRPSMAVADVLPVSVGGDFILYGPIEEAEYIFPAIALADSAFAQLSIERGKRPSREHPLFKIP
jgi:tetrahydromethanopterin S-methyltransferase subunit H